MEPIIRECSATTPVFTLKNRLGPMKNLDSLLMDESFQRWLACTAQPEEAEKWNRWKAASEENERLVSDALRIWRAGKFRILQPPANLDLEWQHLRARLHVEPPNRAAKSRRPLNYGQHTSSGAWPRFGAIAMAMVVFAFFFFRYSKFFQKNDVAPADDYQILSTDFGQRATLDLPEGTKIILNANSNLRYPASWTTQTSRKFELTGEAFFDVSNLGDIPNREFIVYTNDGTIQVTGTRFAVYERGQGTRVVVARGAVEVSSDDVRTAKPEALKKVTLRPGQLLRFRKGNRDLMPRSVKVSPYTTWWRNQIVFEKTPFNEIVERLEETYGVTVKVKEKKLLKRTLSGSIENQNLMVVTDALAGALRVQVVRKGQVIVFGN